VVIDDGRVAPDVSRGDHPPLELLAAYAEGTLAASERAAVERHLSSCAPCRATMGDSVAFLLSEGRITPRQGGFSTWPKVTGAVAGLAAAAALVLAVLANPEWLGRSSRPDLGELVTAFATEPTRLAEGRVTGGFRYAAPPPLSRGGESIGASPLAPAPSGRGIAITGVGGKGAIDLSPDVKIAAARIEAASADQRDVASLWGLGVARLAVRDFTGAIEALLAAAGIDGSNAELQSDLAAAYLARGRNGGGDGDMRMALAAADRAVALKSDLAEARFNRALALEALRMPEAKAAWQAIAAAETDPGWAKEAASHVSSPPQE
jgi:tetratricopeptide (TPR) repeat protein